MPLYGAIEAGGTKFVCGVGTGPEDLVRTTFPTTTPDETLGRVVSFFQGQPKVAAIGIACFGPVDLDPNSPTWGHITNTPKPGWAGSDVADRIQKALCVPVEFDLDVNAAAFAEYQWGAGRGIGDVIYVTVGTGIGAGILASGRQVRGLVHPEMGHMRIPHDCAADPFPGACPFHGDCLEGLACGPALERRWGKKAEELPPDHPAWKLEAHYLALAAINLVCMLSPRLILLGGGVMQNAALFPLIRAEVATLMNGYVALPEIAPPQLGNDSGILGGIALAQQA
jgi:fructokinase